MPTFAADIAKRKEDLISDRLLQLEVVRFMSWEGWKFLSMEKMLLEAVGLGKMLTLGTMTPALSVAVTTGFGPPGLPSTPLGAPLPGRLSRKGLRFGVSK